MALTLIGLLSVMFFKIGNLSLIAIIMIPLHLSLQKSWQKNGKVATEAQEKSGI